MLECLPAALISKNNMLKIKLTISDSGINANGMFIDARGNKASINKSFQYEENAIQCFADMRNRDCEFSLIIIRAV